LRLPDWTNIQEKRGFSVFTPLLALFSYLYGCGVGLKRTTYTRAKKRSLPGFVVSIGNLTVGGTGKTPAASMIAEWALGEGYRVAVLSRGYGGHSRVKVLEVSDGNDINTGPAEAGDEPFLLARNLRGVPVIISKNRYLAGLYAHKKFGTNFYILDDGFQHWALRRDFDLVLINASNPFGNVHLLPWGPLREPVDQLKRADAFIITRVSGDSTGNELKVFLEKRFPGKSLFRGNHTPEKIVFSDGDRVYDPDFLKGKHVMAFAGIARPDVFRETLVKLGADLVFFKGFRDHYSYGHSEIKDLLATKNRINADYMLTTEKDWVRLENLVNDYSDLAYLTIKFNILSDQDAFFGMIKDRVGDDL